jgi:hypothetical protein
MIEHLIHEIEIECPAESLPERIEVNINSLQVGHAIKLGEIQLPEKAMLVGGLMRWWSTACGIGAARGRGSGGRRVGRAGGDWSQGGAGR